MSSVTSVSGCKYHVIFVDDYSRYTWLYPLRSKAQVYDCFVKFKTIAENQFSQNIKQLQTDGGGEYNSNYFHSFLTKHGILHRKSCPHTSQQNGLAERKLRHILETGLSRLAKSHLSNKYWVDAFLTAVFIINRFPTPVLRYSTLYTKLYNKDPNYCMLWIFGYKCYPLLRPYTSHKLEYRSKACIFLRYSHAGYRCLDPIIDKVYLSRHVVFDENSFPAMDSPNSHLSSKLHAGTATPLSLPQDISFPLLSTRSAIPTPTTSQQHIGAALLPNTNQNPSLPIQALPVHSTHTQPSLDQPVLQPESSHDQSNQQSDSPIAQEYPLDQPVQQPSSTLI